MPKINPIENFKLDQYTAEERRALAVKAGKASAYNRGVKRRNLREIARIMLDTELRANDELRKVLNDRGFEDFTEGAAILLAQLNKARNGDTDAAKFLRDTSGQRPADQVAIGNLENKPFESLDLSQLSNDALQQLIAARTPSASEQGE